MKPNTPCLQVSTRGFTHLPGSPICSQLLTPTEAPGTLPSPDSFLSHRSTSQTTAGPEQSSGFLLRKQHFRVARFRSIQIYPVFLTSNSRIQFLCFPLWASFPLSCPLVWFSIINSHSTSATNSLHSIPSWPLIIHLQKLQPDLSSKVKMTHSLHLFICPSTPSTLKTWPCFWFKLPKYSRKDRSQLPLGSKTEGCVKRGNYNLIIICFLVLFFFLTNKSLYHRFNKNTLEDREAAQGLGKEGAGSRLRYERRTVKKLNVPAASA